MLDLRQYIAMLLTYVEYGRELLIVFMGSSMGKLLPKLVCIEHS